LHLLQSSQNLVVGSLGLEAGVEQERVALGPPGVVVTDTPDSDTDAVLLVKAGLDDVAPVGSVGVLDVDLGQGALGSSTAESSHGGGSVGTLAGLQVALRTNTVDGDAGSDPLLDVADHGGRLRVRSLVKAGKCQFLLAHEESSINSLVVVDVTLSVGVSLLGGLEGDADEVFAENVVENAGTEAAVLLE
jgi:hypothetical protein